MICCKVCIYITVLFCLEMPKYINTISQSIITNKRYPSFKLRHWKSSHELLHFEKESEVMLI